MSSVDILRFIQVEIAYDKDLQGVVEAGDYSAEASKKRKKGDLVCPGCGVALTFRKGGVSKRPHFSLYPNTIHIEKDGKFCEYEEKAAMGIELPTKINSTAAKKPIKKDRDEEVKPAYMAQFWSIATESGALKVDKKTIRKIFKQYVSKKIVYSVPANKAYNLIVRWVDYRFRKKKRAVDAKVLEMFQPHLNEVKKQSVIEPKETLKQLEDEYNLFAIAHPIATCKKLNIYRSQGLYKIVNTFSQLEELTQYYKEVKKTLCLMDKQSDFLEDVASKTQGVASGQCSTFFELALIGFHLQWSIDYIKQFLEDIDNYILKNSITSSLDCPSKHYFSLNPTVVINRNIRWNNTIKLFNKIEEVA